MKRFDVVKLFVIWLISFFALGFIVGIASVVYAVRNGLPALDFPNMGKLLLCIVCAVFFGPALFWISRKAQKENVKPIRYLSLGLLIFIYVAVVSNIIPLAKYFFR